MPMIYGGTRYACGTLEGPREVVGGLRYIQRRGFLASEASREFFCKILLFLKHGFLRLINSSLKTEFVTRGTIDDDLFLGN